MHILNAKRYLSARGKLHSIRQQIDNHLRQTVRIAQHHRWQRSVVIKLELHLRRKHQETVVERFKHGAQCEWRTFYHNFSHLETGRIYHIVDQRHHLIHHPPYSIHQLPLLRVERSSLQQPHKPHQRREGVTHLMAKRSAIALTESEILSAGGCRPPSRSLGISTTPINNPPKHQTIRPRILRIRGVHIHPHTLPIPSAEHQAHMRHAARAEKCLMQLAPVRLANQRLGLLLRGGCSLVTELLREAGRYIQQALTAKHQQRRAGQTLQVR